MQRRGGGEQEDKGEKAKGRIVLTEFNNNNK